jgi:hypothetical protein
MPTEALLIAIALLLVGRSRSRRSRAAVRRRGARHPEADAFHAESTSR